VDTETVGCIASKVVLYVSLVFILSIVGSKFLLALVFQWFLSRKFAAAKTSQSSNKKKRAKQIANLEKMRMEAEEAEKSGSNGSAE